MLRRACRRISGTASTPSPSHSFHVDVSICLHSACLVYLVNSHTASARCQSRVHSAHSHLTYLIDIFMRFSSVQRKNWYTEAVENQAIAGAPFYPFRLVMRAIPPPRLPHDNKIASINIYEKMTFYKSKMPRSFAPMCTSSTSRNPEPDRLSDIHVLYWLDYWDKFANPLCVEFVGLIGRWHAYASENKTVEEYPNCFRASTVRYTRAHTQRTKENGRKEKAKTFIAALWWPQHTLGTLTRRHLKRTSERRRTTKIIYKRNCDRKNKVKLSVAKLFKFAMNILTAAGEYDFYYYYFFFTLCGHFWLVCLCAGLTCARQVDLHRTVGSNSFLENGLILPRMFGLQHSSSRLQSSTSPELNR